MGIGIGVKAVGVGIGSAIPDHSPDFESNDLIGDYGGLSALGANKSRICRIGSVHTVGDGRQLEHPVRIAELSAQLVRVGGIGNREWIVAGGVSSVCTGRVM